MGERRGGQDALGLYVGEGVNGSVALRPSRFPPPRQPQLIVFFFFPLKPSVLSPSLRLSIFSLAPNEFYTHVSICTSEEQGESKRKTENTP